MADRHITTGASRPGALGPVRARQTAGGGRQGPPAQPDHGPHDLDAAAARLDRLLKQDAEAGAPARADVPQRGYYLNVYV